MKNGSKGYNVFMHASFQIRVVFNDKNNKPRGYAFIEYEHERDMHGKITVWVCNN